MIELRLGDSIGSVSGKKGVITWFLDSPLVTRHKQFLTIGSIFRDINEPVFLVGEDNSRKLIGSVESLTGHPGSLGTKIVFALVKIAEEYVDTTLCENVYYKKGEKYPLWLKDHIENPSAEGGVCILRNRTYYGGRIETTVEETLVVDVLPISGSEGHVGELLIMKLKPIAILYGSVWNRLQFVKFDFSCL